MARRARMWRMPSPSALCSSPWGFNRSEIACAQEQFDPASFSDALNWFGALVSSVSLVCAIEDSISRISELVMAVKKFAYDERTPDKELDVHDSLQSTLTILGHKLRLKQITGRKALRGLALHHPYARSCPQPGLDQPHRQRRRRVAGGREDRNCHLERAGVPCGLDRRSWRGHSVRYSSAHLRAVLHHQAARLRHRTGPRNCSPHRDAKIRRNDSGGIEAGRHALYRAPAEELLCLIVSRQQPVAGRQKLRAIGCELRAASPSGSHAAITLPAVVGPLLWFTL